MDSFRTIADLQRMANADQGVAAMQDFGAQAAGFYRGLVDSGISEFDALYLTRVYVVSLVRTVLRQQQSKP